jgi:hypothetical protein
MAKRIYAVDRELLLAFRQDWGQGSGWQIKPREELAR